MLYKYVLVFIGAAVPWLEILAVVPLGIVWGLSPSLVMVVAFAGNMSTIFPVIIIFDRIKTWMLRRRKKQGRPSKRNERAIQLFKKYGVIGIAFLGPILTGTHLAAFIGMSMGATRQAMLFWLAVSIAAWTIPIGILTGMGFEFFVE